MRKFLTLYLLGAITLFTCSCVLNKENVIGVAHQEASNKDTVSASSHHEKLMLKHVNDGKVSNKVANLLAEAKLDISHLKNGLPASWGEKVSFKKEGKYPLALRATFQLKNIKAFKSLVLKSPYYIKKLTLNGKTIQTPMKGMLYKTIPNIPASLLKKGMNTLQATWMQSIRKTKNRKTSKISIVPNQINISALEIHLFGLTADQLAFQTGPILGYAGDDFFTVTCRVNMQAEVVLMVNNQKFVSKPALLHSFKVKGLKANTKYNYSLKARFTSKDNFTASLGPYSVKTLAKSGKLTFAVMGDSRGYPQKWAKVAAAVVKAHPAFSVFLGDMVSTGTHDDQWDMEYFSPAKEYFATIPYYAVIGNHERNCSLFTRIFPTPGGKNWSQNIDSVLFIGIDGAMNWASGGKLAIWLENILAKSNAKFIFLFSHYPAWSSGRHGRIKNGFPVEKSIKNARHVIMPLLKKYNASAMFAGHDHFYERSEPPSGVSMIIAGNAGAPMRNKTQDAKKQNPHSKVFAAKLHYSLMKIDGNVCTMKVFTPEGTLIDSRTWNARKVK